jgi:hypothetical protein
MCKSILLIKDLENQRQTKYLIENLGVTFLDPKNGLAAAYETSPMRFAKKKETCFWFFFVAA